MLNDIEFLKAENLYLRGLVEKNAEQLALVETGYPVRTKRPPDGSVSRSTRLRSE